MDSRLQAFIRRLPKAEIHLHLEGSIRPATFLELSRKYGTEWKDSDEAGLLESLFRYSNFNGFLETYKTICQHLREPQDYLRLLEELVVYFQEENIRYAEIIYTPSIPWKFSQPGDEILEGLLARSEELGREHGVTIRWILDCVRQFGREMAERTAQLAVEHRSRGVVALGLGGDEKSLPTREYQEVFVWAKANGLYIHVHAGEVGEPPAIWEALEVLGANRIGHGIQAARDSQLMEYLRQHAIALDICLSSNRQTGAWPLISDHPFQLLYRRGVPVTLNTDDPGLFQTRLGEEYWKAARAFQLSRQDLARIALQAIHSSFLPQPEKSRWMKELYNQIQQALPD